ncbi:hypothetical protein EON63_24035 [archaeon]|nr:MAG: hypothetical protein EON63_24035 [archaeon]
MWNCRVLQEGGKVSVWYVYGYHACTVWICIGMGDKGLSGCMSLYMYVITFMMVMLTYVCL